NENDQNTSTEENVNENDQNTSTEEDTKLDINAILLTITELKEKNKQLLYTISTQNDLINSLKHQHQSELEKQNIKLLEYLIPLIQNIFLLDKHKEIDPNHLKFPIETTKTELDKILQTLNISVINPTLDSEFNPNEHEAITSNENSQNNKIKSVAQYGFKYKEKTILSAKVHTY
ncbi:MAG: nucleotide exchange factor GrpE, partial [Pseudomonadota bacterium]